MTVSRRSRLGAQCRGDVELACHLGPLVPRDRLQQDRWQISHAGGQRIVEMIAVTRTEMKEPNEAGLTFDQRADR